MKKLLSYICITLLFTGCKEEITEILDQQADINDITRIELRADHKTVIPDGISSIEFHTIIYGKKKVPFYGKDENDMPSNEPTEIEYVIPIDQLPQNIVSIHNEDGTKLENSVFQPQKDMAGSTIRFYAQCGTLRSNSYAIAIREVPEEEAQEIVVPVVFHMLIPPANISPTYEISSSYIEKNLKHVSDIFNKRVTTDPNGGKVKITFKPALYNVAGVKLQEPGKNILQLTTSDMNKINSYAVKYKDEAYNKFIVEYKKKLIWDCQKYLNIWLIKFSSNESETGGYSYKFWAPTDMHPSYELSSIPGIKFTHKESFTNADVADCREVGMIINYTAFLNPQTQGNNDFSLATVFGGYYGLLNTHCSNYSKLNPDGDNDYCPDTYNYDYSYYPTVYKANNLYKQPENTPDRPLEWFTSFNIMDYYSRKNSISADQAKRVKLVLKQCPSRWNYQSDWALTGKK